MNSSQVEEYLRAVEEMVMDEEKIVTYKLLSRTHSLNVNTAKQLLNLYLIKQKKNTPCPISATHLLAGSLKDGTSLVSIINDDKLDEAYSKYDKITSEHVYSVQKGKASGLEKNSQMLFAVDSSLPPAKSYPIKYHKVLKEKTGDTVKENKSPDVQVKAEAKVVKPEEKQKENKVSSASPRKDDKQKGKKPGQIANFFNNQAQKKKVDKQEKPDVKSEAIKKEDTPKNVETPVPSTPDEEKTKVKPSSSSKSGKKAKAKETKKRKRIVSASEDSESDEEKADAELCAEPEVPEIQERLRISDDEDDLFAGKRKRKKVVSRTVLHDDGFMETFKEVVYETDSDNESPKQKKKEQKVNEDTSRKTVDKVVEPAGGKVKGGAQKGNPKKQSTLFSFFKKN